jgi:hypothetical protein
VGAVAIVIGSAGTLSSCLSPDRRRRGRDHDPPYRDARARWIDGDAIPFPVGTDRDS